MSFSALLTGEAAIMEIIGHASVAINLGYTHPGQQAPRRAVETLPNAADEQDAADGRDHLSAPVHRRA